MGDPPPHTHTHTHTHTCTHTWTHNQGEGPVQDSDLPLSVPALLIMMLTNIAVNFARAVRTHSQSSHKTF